MQSRIGENLMKSSQLGSLFKQQSTKNKDNRSPLLGSKQASTKTQPTEQNTRPVSSSVHQSMQRKLKGYQQALAQSSQIVSQALDG